MRVAMMTYQTRPRGGVVHASKLAEALAKQGVNVELFSLFNLKQKKKKEEVRFHRPLSVPSYIYGFDPKSNNAVKLTNQMIGLYVKNLPKDFDIYHTHDCIGGNALFKLRDKWNLPAPTVRTIHHIDSFSINKLNEIQERGILACDQKMVVSKYWQRQLKTDYGIKSYLTYNGIELKVFNLKVKGKKVREKHELGDGPLVLFVGGTEPRKGLEYLLYAMELIKKDIPDAKLLAVGKEAFSSSRGERTFFNILIKRLGIRDSVKFAYDIEESELPKYYAACDVFALPSRMEGWGLSLMEAMACGKPVVATKVGGIPELVKNKENGYLVRPGDASALAKKIVYLLKHEDEAKEMGRDGRKKVRTYSWDKTAKKVKGIYERILKAS
ncbi:MAG: MSMEG_0565 family glycosyltransferase [Thermoplasmata archaeon]|nr:MAG: MSMEG_0565 family glycosyltransferase [Thermoplasmata archaeon]